MGLKHTEPKNLMKQKKDVWMRLHEKSVEKRIKF